MVEILTIDMSPEDFIRMQMPGFDRIPYVLAIFNGPAGAGKDEACEFLRDKKGFIHAKMSEPLKEIVSDATGFSMKEVRNNKDKLEFRGKTLRQHQIDLFNYLSAQFGEEILARTMTSVLRENKLRMISARHGGIPMICVSDCGRQPELNYILDQFGPKNCLLIRLHRDGFTFDGDIRSYVYHDEVASIDMDNNGTLDDLRTKVDELLTGWTKKWADDNEALMTELGFQRMKKD